MRPEYAVARCAVRPASHASQMTRRASHVCGVTGAVRTPATPQAGGQWWDLSDHSETEALKDPEPE